VAVCMGMPGSRQGNAVCRIDGYWRRRGIVLHSLLAISSATSCRLTGASRTSGGAATSPWSCPGAPTRPSSSLGALTFPTRQAGGGSAGPAAASL
jgi:hypothetical protein